MTSSETNSHPAHVKVDFAAGLSEAGLAPLRRLKSTTLQVNIGLQCNLACHHCHVESGPKRTERLDRAGIDRLLELLARSPQVTTLDITGGAPEMHPDFRTLVEGARTLGRRVLDRCNLTILEEPGQEDTADFLADQGVDIVASPSASSAASSASAAAASLTQASARFSASTHLAMGLTTTRLGTSFASISCTTRTELLYRLHRGR